MMGRKESCAESNNQVLSSSDRAFDTETPEWLIDKVMSLFTAGADLLSLPGLTRPQFSLLVTCFSCLAAIVKKIHFYVSNEGGGV